MKDTEPSQKHARLRGSGQRALGMAYKSILALVALALLWVVAGIVTQRLPLPDTLKPLVDLAAPLLISLLAGLLFVRRFEARFEEVFAVAERLADGDWTTEIALRPGRTSDELDRLLELLERVRHNNSGLMQQVHGAASRVQRSSRSLGHTAQGLYTDISTFSKALESLSEGAESQTANTEEMQQGIDRLAVETAEHRELAVSTEQEAQSAREAAIDSGRVVGGILEEWETQLTGLRAINEDIEAFEATARQIATIVEVISEVAHRTHVLSLNAGLEAIRAGDGGAEFVGLAEEIRGLSEDTARRAGSIEDILRRFVHQQHELLNRLRENIQGLDAGRQQVGTVRGRLDQIVHGMDTIATRIVRLARAFETQAERMLVLRTQAEAVHRISAQHARLTRETVTQSRDQMVVGADELLHEARELDKISSDLGRPPKTASGKRETV